MMCKKVLISKFKFLLTATALDQLKRIHAIMWMMSAMAGGSALC